MTNENTQFYSPVLLLKFAKMGALPIRSHCVNALLLIEAQVTEERAYEVSIDVFTRLRDSVAVSEKEISSSLNELSLIQTKFSALKIVPENAVFLESSSHVDHLKRLTDEDAKLKEVVLKKPSYQDPIDVLVEALCGVMPSQDSISAALLTMSNTSKNQRFAKRMLQALMMGIMPSQENLKKAIEEIVH
jgi:hypothetical protein